MRHSWFYIAVVLFASQTLFAEPKRTLSFVPEESVLPDYAKTPEQKTRFLRSAVHFLLNSMSWDPKPIQISPPTAEQKKQRQFSANVPEGISDAQLTYLRNNNPYDCSKTKSGPLRPDWLANQFVENYNEVLGIGEDYSALAKKLGIPEETSDAKWKRLLLASPLNGGKQNESRISRAERAVLSTTGAGKHRVWLTIDAEISTFTRAARNPFSLRQEGVLQSAGELIFRLPNQLQGYGLVAQDRDTGKLTMQNQAPYTFVVNTYRARNYSSVWRSKHLPSHTPQSRKGAIDFSDSITESKEPIYLGDCATCHRGGLIGPQRGVSLDHPAIRRSLASRIAEIDKVAKELSRDGTPEAVVAATRKEKTSLARELKDFTQAKLLSGDEYAETTETDAATYVAALKKLDAFYPDPEAPDLPVPIASDLSAVYLQKMSTARMARELGLEEDDLLTYLAKNPELHRELRFGVDGPRGEGQFDRGGFETHFCDLKAKIASQPKRASGAPRPKLPPLATFERTHF